MIMVDKDGVIVLVNAQVENLFGYNRDELLGKKIEELVPKRFREAHPGHRGGYFANPQVRAMGHGRDLYGLRKDGGEIPVEIALNPITTESGQFVLASVVDISRRESAQKNNFASSLRRRPAA